MTFALHAQDLAPRLSSDEGRRILALYESQRAAAGGLPDAAALEAALADLAIAPALVRPDADGGDGAPETDQAGVGDAYTQALRDRRAVLAVQEGGEGWERLILPCRGPDQAEQLFEIVQPRGDQAGLLRAVLEASCYGMIAVRALRDGSGALADAVVLAANRRAAAYLGRIGGAMVGGSLLALMPGLKPLGAWARCGRVVAEQVTERFDLQCSRDGLDTWLQVTAAPLGDGFVLTLSDVTDLKYALFDMEVLKEEAERAREDLATEVSARRMVEGELRRIAVTDGLTGVLNRRGFDEIARTMTATARRYGHPLSVIAIDIDHFKRVNDVYGHAAGDAVLVGVAQIINAELRQDSDAVSRMGGEEFMVLLPHTDAEGAAIVAERLRRRVMETPITIGEQAITVTASFGVRNMPECGNTERMLIEADAALYTAKQSGRNCVVVSDPLAPRREAPHPTERSAA